MDSKPSNGNQERRRGLGPAVAPSFVCLLYCAAHRHAQSYGKNCLTGALKAKTTEPTDIYADGKRTFLSPISA